MMSSKVKKDYFRTRERLQKIGGFYLSKWNFIKRIEFVSINDSKTAVPCVIFGSGPFIHVHIEDKGPANNNSLEQFFTRLCVFEATGTHVEGIADLHNTYCLVWGGPYFALVLTDKLFLGGVLCQQDVLSAGKQIVTAKVFENPHPRKGPYGPSQGPTVFELYFTDGTVQEIMCRRKEIGDSWNLSWVQSMTIHNTYRLPLKPGERITSGFTGSPGTLLGTSQGRLIWIKDTQVQFITEPIQKAAIKQIWTQRSTHNPNAPVFILVENGTLISWKKKKHLLKLRGRYTRISEFVFNLDDKAADGMKFIIAGDRDGGVTIIRVYGGLLEIQRIFRNRMVSAITAIELFSRSYAILGTESGELQLFDMRQLYPTSEPVDRSGDVPPDCYYKSTDGWYYLNDDTFFKAFNRTSIPVKDYLERKNMKLTYRNFPYWEIAVAYTTKELACCITDYIPEKPEILEKVFKIPTDEDEESWRLIQVILLEPYILLQYDSGCVQVQVIKMKEGELDFVTDFYVEADRRLTTAVCMIEPENTTGFDIYPFDLMVAFRDGDVAVTNVDWDDEGYTKDLEFSGCFAGLRGSYLVSSISSEEHMGKQQCLLLSRKGIVYHAARAYWLGQQKPTYTTVAEQDLSGVLGNGHSLIEIDIGILATGFKRDTLHVCKLFPKYRTYCHLFSVDTRSSRLPFSIVEKHKEGKFDQLVVSYFDKCKRIIEERFHSFDESPKLTAFGHSGIITNGMIVNFGCEHSTHIQEYFYSGDTNGIFCIWTFNEKAVTRQSYLNAYKLNGAVTGIDAIDACIAVCTSQGDLNLFKRTTPECIQLLPTLPYNLGQKITHLTYGNSPGNQPFLLAFLEDGLTKQIKITSGKDAEYDVKAIVTVKSVARFPSPIKMAICSFYNKIYYITALGVDGILLRVQLSPQLKWAKMSWKISVIKKFDMPMSTMFMVGDPQGWVYILIAGDNRRNWFYIDRLHKHEVIDAGVYSNNDGLFIFSMDVGGSVAIRQPLKPSYRPVIWASAVPSPRKLLVLQDKREIVVLGRGIATKNF